MFFPFEGNEYDYNNYWNKNGQLENVRIWSDYNCDINYEVLKTVSQDKQIFGEQGRYIRGYDLSIYQYIKRIKLKKLKPIYYSRVF